MKFVLYTEFGSLRVWSVLKFVLYTEFGSLQNSNAPEVVNLTCKVTETYCVVIKLSHSGFFVIHLVGRGDNKTESLGDKPSDSVGRGDFFYSLVVIFLFTWWDAVIKPGHPAIKQSHLAINQVTRSDAVIKPSHLAIKPGH